jgi:hypothetical protein
MAAAKIDLKARLGKKPGDPVAPVGAAPQAPAQQVGFAPQAVPAASPSHPPAAANFAAGPAAPQAFAGGPAFGSSPPPAQQARPVQAAAPVAARPAGFAARPMGVAGPGGVSIPPPPGFGPKPMMAAAQPQPKPAAPQLAIKMEMGEEVLQAQKAGRKKTLVLAVAAAAVGLGMGFGMGQLAKGNEGAKAAVEGAELLIKEIDAANIVLAELDQTLSAAGQKLQAGEFPSAEIEKLGAIDVPFDGSNLLNKGIGRYNQSAVTMLVSYVNAVSEAEDQKDKIRRLFGAAKESFLAEAAEKTAPTVKWGVAVKGGPGGPWGAMSPIKPFGVVDKDKKANWPSELESAGKKAQRMTQGDITKTDGEIIPIDPGTQKMVCPDTLSLRLMGALAELRNDLKSDETPGQERMGVSELGEKLMDQLRKIGGPG